MRVQLASGPILLYITWVDKIVGKYNTHPALNKLTKTFTIKSGPWLGNLNTNFTQGAGILTLYCSS